MRVGSANLNMQMMMNGINNMNNLNSQNNINSEMPLNNMSMTDTQGSQGISGVQSTQISTSENPVAAEIGDLMQQWIIETLIKIFQDVLDMGQSEQGTNGDDDLSFGNNTNAFLSQLSQLSQLGQLMTQQSAFAANEADAGQHQAGQYQAVQQMGNTQSIGQSGAHSLNIAV